MWGRETETGPELAWLRESWTARSVWSLLRLALGGRNRPAVRPGVRAGLTGQLTTDLLQPVFVERVAVLEV